MSAGGAVMFSSPTVAERADVCRTAGERVTVKVSLPILIFLQLFHSSIQLGSCRPLSLSFPLPSSASCDNKGKFIWARGAAVLGSPIDISIVLHLFFWSAGEFSVRTRFLDRRLPSAFSLIQCEQISQTFFLFSPFFCNIVHCGT